MNNSPSKQTKILDFLKKRISTTSIVLVLFIIMVTYALYIWVGGMITGRFVKKQLDGLVFSNVDHIEFDGNSYVAVQYAFSGSRMTIKSLNVTSETSIEDINDNVDLGNIETFYWIRKTSPGKLGKYYILWNNRVGGAVRYELSLEYDKNGEIQKIIIGSAFDGLTINNGICHRLNKPIL